MAADTGGGSWAAAGPAVFAEPTVMRHGDDSNFFTVSGDVERSPDKQGLLHVRSPGSSTGRAWVKEGLLVL